MSQIRVKNGKQQGRVFSLSSISRLVLGRDEACELQIVDQGVSREHAEIYCVGEMVFIRDLESRNGSFVNNERIKEELLREGDVIRVGGTQLLFEGDKATREQDLEFEENHAFKTSLELKLEDLYVLEGGPGGREGELFKAICQSAQIVQSERNEKKLFEKMLDLIQEYIPADNIYLFLRDESTGSVIPRAMRQKSGRKNAPISRSILRRVITEARAILTADAMKDDRFKADDSILMNQIRAVLCVPIQYGNGPARGAIYAVNSSLTETFEQSDLQLITAMGAQLALSLENLSAIRDRRRMFLRTIGRLVSALEGSSLAQQGHAERVSAFASAIASEMGLPDREILYTSLAGLLHDIGKVPSIAKPIPATAQSGAAAHVLSGIAFLKDIPGIQNIVPAIRSHHERYDGSGGPDGLKGDAIPISARIIAVASDFDRLVCPPDKPAPVREADATAIKRAFTELDQRTGTFYDPDVVRALIVSHRHGSLRTVDAIDLGQSPAEPFKALEDHVEDKVLPMPLESQTDETARAAQQNQKKQAKARK